MYAISGCGRPFSRAAELRLLSGNYGSVAGASILWLMFPVENPELVWPLGGVGLRNTQERLVELYSRLGRTLTEEQRAEYARRLELHYASEISYTDEHVGRLLDELDARGILASLGARSGRATTVWTMGERSEPRSAAARA